MNGGHDNHEKSPRSRASSFTRNQLKMPFAELVASYLDDPHFIHRVSIEQVIIDAVSDPENRLVLVTGEPGVGKSALAASLASQNPGWLQYFLRRDSVTKISGGDATSLLLSAGHQLASRHPEAFQLQNLEIVVRQRIGTVSAGGAVTAIRIDDLRVSPFTMTALGVDQYADVIDGTLEGVAVGSATLEPRLLAPPELQYLALIDPANVLAAQDPDARIVLLIDALDDAAAGDWSGSILNWLRQLPELPPNMRIIVTSRPGGLDDLARRSVGLKEIRINGGMAGVREDLASYAQRLMTKIPAGIAGNRDSLPSLVAELVDRADGNFAYLAAFARAVESAVDAHADGGQRLGGLSRLLDYRELPAGLDGLYAHFVGLIRADVAALGSLDTVEDGGTVPAWEGVGARLLGVLSIARGKLTAEQLKTMAGIRVWSEDVSAVLSRFRPFLDSAGDGMQLFHASVGEYLTSPQALTEHPHLAVNAQRWHRSIVRSYQGNANSWRAVKWSAVDEYGLVHLAEHVIADTRAEKTALLSLANPEYRAEMARRFGSDILFKGVIELASRQLEDCADLKTALCGQFYLGLVGTQVQEAALSVPPAVLALKSRLGRAEEALEAIALMPPSQQRFVSLWAVRKSLTKADRVRLGPDVGIDRLVRFALEVQPQNRYSDLARGLVATIECLEAVALELAPQDLDRALRLAALASELHHDIGMKIADKVLLLAAATAPSVPEALSLLGRIQGDRQVAAALDLADAMARQDQANQAVPEDLLAFVQHAAGEDEGGPVLEARLATFWHRCGSPQAQAAMKRATRLLDENADARTIADAANAVAEASPDTALRWLDRLDQITAAYDNTPVLLFTDWTGKVASDVDLSGLNHTMLQAALLDAAELSIHLGDATRGRKFANRALDSEVPAAERARTTAAVSAIMAALDSHEAAVLADTAIKLIDEAAAAGLASNLDLTEVAFSLAEWDISRAVEVARRMTRGRWVGMVHRIRAEDRHSVLAELALNIADTEPELAMALVTEVSEANMLQARLPARIIRSDPQLNPGGLFWPRGRHVPQTEATAEEKSHYDSYLINVIGYWEHAKIWRIFESPADKVRWAEVPSNVDTSHHTLASAFATLAEETAYLNAGAARQVADSILDSVEKAIGLAGLLSANHRDSALRERLLDEIRTILNRIPKYDIVPVISGKVEDIVHYHNPWVRARFEVAVRLASVDPVFTHDLMREIEIPYLVQSITSSFYLDAASKMWYIGCDSSDIEHLLGEVMKFVATIQEIDPGQADMIRAQLVQNLASRDRKAAQSLQTEITGVTASASARIRILKELTPPAQLAGALEDLLSSLELDKLPHHRARLAVEAVQALADVDVIAAQGLANAEFARIRGETGFFSALAHVEFSYLPECLASGEILTEAGQVWLGTDRAYFSAHLTRDMFVAALANAPREAPGFLRRAVEQSWPTAMAALETAAGWLVHHCGPDISNALLATTQAAWGVLNRGQLPAHLDGVAVREDFELPWESQG